MDFLSRTELLLGEKAIETLKNSRVAVFGIGGVGGFAVEALARAGVGALDLIDHDTISQSNINRQIIALHSTVGESKVEVAKQRILDIHPDCEVRTHPLFYLPETAEQLDLTCFDYIVDAVDTVSAKLFLCEQAAQAGVPLIACMGTGNKLDSTAFRVSDIFQTKEDPLARVMRKELKKRGITSLKVVYSEEKSVRAQAQKLKSLMEHELPADSSRRDLPGSVSFVPGVAGMILAGEVIKDLIGYGG